MNGGDDQLGDVESLHRPSFEVSTVAYRRATATSRRAQKMAAQHAATGSVERRLREIDAVIETIVLTQAACEGWIFLAYRHTEVDPAQANSWIQCWIDAPRLICDRLRAGDRPPTRELETTTIDTLRRVSAWRNFLLHGDKSSRDRLRKIITQEPDVQLLTAELAAQTISGVDQAFADLGSLLGVHGVTGLNSAFLWIADDE